MKVKKLLELLQTVDLESEVYTEGCDCIGDAVGISVPTRMSSYGNHDKKSVIIRRSNGACYPEDGEIQK